MYTAKGIAVTMYTAKGVAVTMDTAKDVGVTMYAAKGIGFTIRTAKGIRFTMYTAKGIAVTIKHSVIGPEGQAIPCIRIQTHKMFKRTLFIRGKEKNANFRGNPLYQATKQHPNNR